MQIFLNGQGRHFSKDSMTIAELLSQIGQGEQRVAVEVNAEVVPKSRHDTQMLCEGDRVEIIHAIGGG